MAQPAGTETLFQEASPRGCTIPDLSGSHCILHRLSHVAGVLRGPHSSNAETGLLVRNGPRLRGNLSASHSSEAKISISQGPPLILHSKSPKVPSHMQLYGSLTRTTFSMILRENCTAPPNPSFSAALVSVEVRAETDLPIKPWMT